jgi:hypothetical protein
VALSLVYPELFTSILEALRVLMGDVFEIFRIDCIAPLSLFSKFVIIMLLPAVSCAAIEVARWIADCTAGSNATAEGGHAATTLKNRENAYYRMYFVIFLLYPLLSRTIFHMFQCQTLHDHEAWHVDDFDVDCNSGEYTAFYAIAMVFVFIYPIGIPVGLFILLWRDEQRQANDPSANPLPDPSLAFVRKDYKGVYYYFE